MERDTRNWSDYINVQNILMLKAFNPSSVPLTLLYI